MQKRRGTDGSSDAGVTLVELTIVLLVVGILLGVAAPMFMAAQNGSKDASAKSHAILALKAQKALLVSEGSFASDDATLQRVEPNLDFRRFSDPAEAGEASVRGAIYIRDASGTTVSLAARSGSGVCFWTRVVPSGSTEFAKGTCRADEASSLQWGAGW